MKAKLSFAEVSAIKRMNQKQLTAFITEVYGYGVKDTEDELENATPERWLEIVSSSEKVKEHFAIWDGDRLRERLLKEFTESNVDRIMRIITEVM